MNVPGNHREHVPEDVGHCVRMAPVDTLPVRNRLDIDEESAQSPHAIVQRDLDASHTIGEYRGRLADTLANVKNNPWVEEEIARAKHNLDAISKGHDNVALEDLELNIQGVNKEVGTQRTAINRTGLTLEQLQKNHRGAEETLNHENHKTKGHAGQRQDLQGLVLPNEPTDEDSALADKELTEGDEEVQMNMLMRGNANSSRTNQPTEVYGSGQKKVLRAGQKTIERYVRNGASRINTQAEIFQRHGTTRGKMIDLMNHARFSDQEIHGVLEKNQQSNVQKPSVGLAKYEPSLN